MSFLPEGYNLPKRPKPERLWYCKEHCQGVPAFQLAGINRMCQMPNCTNYAHGKVEIEHGTIKTYIPIMTGHV